MRNKLSLPLDSNSKKAANAKDYECSVWERLSPEQRRAMNKLRDEVKK